MIRINIRDIAKWGSAQSRAGELSPRLTRVFLYIFIFFQPFRHTTSVKEISFYLMIASFLAGANKMELRRRLRGLSVRAFFILVLAALLSISFSPYPLESLNAFRKNMLVETGVFLAVISGFDSFEGIKPLIFTTAFSFAALSVIILIQSLVFGHFSLASLSHTGGTWRGYSMLAAFYVPLTFGCLFASGRLLKGVLAISLLAEFFLMVMYGNRTPLAAVIISALAVVAASARVRYFFAALVLLAAIGSGAYLLKPGFVKPYTLPLSYGVLNYPSMVERYAIWKGTAEIISRRPLLGYGYGWKKLSWVSGDAALLEQWRQSNRQAFDYFSRTGYGGANPHNLVLQVLFETGLLGLAAFLVFWATIYKKAINFLYKPERSQAGLFASYGILSVLISYLVINVTNGLWEETSGNLMIMLSGITLIASRGDDKARNVQ